MPTHEEPARFLREWRRLTPEQQTLFLAAVLELVEDLTEATPLERGSLERAPFRPGLGVKAVEGQTGVFELTWAGDGRATFQYGAEKQPGDPHIVWRHIGGHDIFEDP